MGSIEVVILGQRYTIKGDAEEDYIRELAGYVDSKMKEVLHAAPNTSPLKASILAALNIADELHSTEKTQADLKGLEEKANALSSLFD
ncbi:cell division protein ZapA [bacterium BMS3Abin07]|nr:cell division protein ZapA [bacterium BMS3Abin07]GBE32457.1 cell division protein ZapA [bacterium BMS3Bbin05]HDL20541.1 cell division protein ZapA [Nitrospirota bacterium]HDO23136.1 cell division protein ZapA [Nitrospirota bacterium]